MGARDRLRSESRAPPSNARRKPCRHLATGGGPPRQPRLARATLAALAALACASAQPKPVEEGEGEAAVEVGPSRIEVDNTNVLDMTIFAVRGGVVVRLGTVSAKTTQTFELPDVFQNTAAELRFLVDPIGSTEAYLSDAVFVRPGDEITLRVGTTLPQSSVSVF